VTNTLFERMKIVTQIICFLTSTEGENISFTLGSVSNFHPLFWVSCKNCYYSYSTISLLLYCCSTVCFLKNASRLLQLVYSKKKTFGDVKIILMCQNEFETFVVLLIAITSKGLEISYH